MELVRTTLRIRKELKKEAEKLALEKDTSFQNIINEALLMYLATYPKKPRKITIQTHDIGVPLDNLTRDMIYGEPDIIS